MKTLLLLPALSVIALLCGCPETKVPQTPPSVPQPKAAASTAVPLPALAQAASQGFLA